MYVPSEFLDSVVDVLASWAATPSNKTRILCGPNGAHLLDSSNPAVLRSTHPTTPLRNDNRENHQLFVNSFRMTTVLPFHNYKHKQQFYELRAEQKYFPKWKRNSTPTEPAVRTMALGLAQVLQISVRLQQETAGSQVGFCVQALVRCGFKYNGKHRLSQRGVWKRQEHISLTCYFTLTWQRVVFFKG